jgi:AraC-like DNA-binding protein
VHERTVVKGLPVVKTGQRGRRGQIRPVRFAPPTPETGDTEVTNIEGIRTRGGPQEFLAPQRLDFDLVMRIDRGQAEHTVDFTEYQLGRGDVLWVRAGQVQQWGRIQDIEGPVVMFPPHVVDDRTRELIKAARACTPNHWSADSVQGSPSEAAWELLLAAGRLPAQGDQVDLRSTLLAHAVAGLLTQLALLQPLGSTQLPTPTHEAYLWLRVEIDRSFQTWHQVKDYAARLGYSTRTLNRLARDNTGLSAKQLIDDRIVLEAKRLLSHADGPVADVAAQLGFDDPSNFSAYFHRRTGLTPGTFRTQARATGGA